MANNNENILDKARTMGLARPEAGMKAPDGYFEAFAGRMSSRLPMRPELETPDQVKEPPRTLWSAVRPYVYMAAMFAGVWCMLNLFHSLSGGGELVPMDSNPVLAKAMTTDSFYDYVIDDLSARDVVDQMVDEGLFDEDFDMSVFSEEFQETDSNQILLQ